MLIGIVGGSGYVGSVLLKQLGLPEGARGLKAASIEILDLKAPPPALYLDPKRIKYVPIDASDERTFSGYAPRYDFIIHLAAQVGYPACNKDPEAAHRNNVLTTENVMRFKKKGARVLFASTISNYGDQTGRVDETSPTRPNSIYGKTKVLAEKIVLADPSSIIYRFAGAFGVSPSMRNDNLIHDFTSKAVQGETVSIYENTFIRQFIHVGDMARSIIFALQNWDRMKGNIYNVGNPRLELTKKEIVETIAQCCRFDFRFEESGSDAEKRNYPISFEKLTRVGFVPKMDLKPAVNELVQFYRNDFTSEDKSEARAAA